MNSSTATIKRNVNGNLVWSNGSFCEKSPRQPRSGSQEESAREYINPVARALQDDETWTIGDNGEFYPIHSQVYDLQSGANRTRIAHAMSEQ